EHHVSHYWEMDFIKKGKRQLLYGATGGVSCTMFAELYHRLSAGDFGLQSGVRESVREHWQEIKCCINDIPTAEELRQLLAKVGGPATIEQLGIAKELAEQALREAHHVRPERYTLLHAYNTAR